MKIHVRFISNEGKKVRRVVTKDKRRVLRISEATNWQKAHLKVVYEDGDNEGVYFTRKDFNLALNAFTEK